MAMQHSLRLYSIIGCFLFVVGVDANQALVVSPFSEEERTWITQHPVIRVGALRDLSPIEYMEDGVLKGLSAEYLDFIRRKTGLTFAFNATDSPQERIDLLLSNQIDLISAVRVNGPMGSDPRLINTSAYLKSTAVVITRIGQPPILDTDRLNHLTVTLPYLDQYREAILSKAPDAQLIVGGRALTMLQQVANGQADAAVATEAYLLPFLFREFQGQLQISGVLTDMASEIGMSTRKNEVLLRSIIQKILSSVSSDEIRQLHGSWLHQHATPVFPFSEIVEHYPHEVVLALLIVALLSAVVFQSHRSRQRAERNEQEKAMFLAVMSHEIRSPMNVILSAVELLVDTPMNIQQKKYTRLASDGAKSLLTLLDNVLDISKLEAGQVKLEYEPVDVAMLIRKTVDLYSQRAKERHISLTVDGDLSPPLLMLDEARLGQVLHNLLSNAIKFTEYGSVEVNFSLSSAPAARCVQLCISVTDTGIGISKDAQERLFRPYAQVTRTYMRSGGTGLGLTICRDLLKLMKGTILLNSEPGQGTQIEFTVPAEVAPLAAPVAEIHYPVTKEQDRSLRILVVEDISSNQVVLQAQLEGFGCSPVIARDGAQALAYFKQGIYDMVLMDCDLPDRDGYSLAILFRILEQNAKQARCPIIAISAYSDSNHVARCFASDMDGNLGKPVSLGKLQDTLELWCGVELTLCPQPFSNGETLTTTNIRDLLEQDLHSLLEAVLLRDTESARHFAHRLHGAALSLEWGPIARSAEDMENLLQTDIRWEDERYSSILRTIVHTFRTG
jgi:two-component system sensor histidine kinase EvgS